MMSEYYVFNTESLAISANNFIENVAGFPWTGIYKGKIAPVNHQKTMKWAKVKQRDDGKWCVPRIPEEFRTQHPIAVIDYFNENFPHTIENYEDSWFYVEGL